MRSFVQSILYRDNFRPPWKFPQASSQWNPTSILLQEAAAVLTFFFLCFPPKFILPFLERHINRTTRYGPFMCCFFFQHNVLRCIQVVVGINGSFFKNCWVLFHCIHNTIVYSFWVPSRFLPLTFDSWASVLSLSSFCYEH